MEPWSYLRRSTIAVCIAGGTLAGCRGVEQALPGPLSPLTAGSHVAAGRDISNVIVIIQQHRSFDNLFAGFPNADAPTTGLESTGQRVPLRRISLRHDACVGFAGQPYFDTIYDRGKMDGWNLIDPGDPSCPYTAVDRSETKPYWDLAKRYAIGDRMFASTHFSYFVNNLYLIGGTTKIAAATYDIGMNPIHWGCFSPAGTTTWLLKHGRFERDRGPFPCFRQFPTIANLLDDAGVSWKCYFGGRSDFNDLYDPFGYIEYVADGTDWSRNMSRPATNILNDVAQSRLPAVSWVFSPLRDSDAPGFGGGPKWIASIASAVRRSAYWPHAAIVVAWEDSGDGNYYDDAAPSQISAMGLGFRVPVLVISRFARRHYVSHTDYQFGSILKFIEMNWNLGSLHSTDERSHSIGDVFD